MNAKFIFDFFFANKIKIVYEKLETNSTKRILFHVNRFLRHCNCDKVKTKRRQSEKMKNSNKLNFEKKDKKNVSIFESREAINEIEILHSRAKKKRNKNKLKANSRSKTRAKTKSRSKAKTKKQKQQTTNINRK